MVVCGCLVESWVGGVAAGDPPFAENRDGRAGGAAGGRAGAGPGAGGGRAFSIRSSALSQLTPVPPTNHDAPSFDRLSQPGAGSQATQDGERAPAAVRAELDSRHCPALHFVSFRFVLLRFCSIGSLNYILPRTAAPTYMGPTHHLICSSLRAGTRRTWRRRLRTCPFSVRLICIKTCSARSVRG